jgi:signal transduction histidine kinase/DNA-binding response OmpR family regulator
MNKATKILVVDDEPGMREGCRRVLAAEGFHVETAEDGLAGLELFQSKKDFAAAIVDIKMPRMEGIELIQRIHGIDEDVLLLVITAYSTIDSAVEATKRGAYGYVPKPFTPDELLLQVRKGLEKRELKLESKRLKEEREMRLLEIALERSKCGTIIRCMTDGVLVVNREGQIVLRNAAAAKAIPDCASLPLPCPLDALKCGDLKELIRQSMKAESDEGIISNELCVGLSTYLASVSPVTESKGVVSGAVVTLRDITELKKLEAAKSMFVSMVAHEIKGPLAVTESYLNILLNGLARGNPEKERSMIERSLVRISTLRKMVIELMNITAMETGNFTLKRVPIDITEVAREAVSSYKEHAESKGITLTFEEEAGESGSRGADTGGISESVLRGSVQEPVVGPAAGAKVLADRDTMLSVFTNLVDNAIKYTPEKGNVRVWVERNGIFARVRVQDDGIGMTGRESKKLFEEFYRVKNKLTENIPGTGLGLSMVKRIVEMHQGSVELETAPGKGSTFSVNIPLVL